MKLHFQQADPMMTAQATSRELIALGQVVQQYITYIEQQPNAAKEQLECIALLRSFQGRVVAQIYPPKEGQR